MRNYQGMRLAPNMSLAQLREEAQRADSYLRHLSAALGRITLAPQGSGPAGGSGGTVVDLTQFWYLPGRLPEQRAYGRNVLEANFQAAGGVSEPSFYKKVGFFAADGNDGIGHVWLSIEGTQGPDTHVGTAQRLFNANRHWAFPAFNQIAGGSNFGVHYFVDQDEWQLIQNKTFTGGWVFELPDTAGLGLVTNIARGETQVGTAQATVLLHHASYPTTTWKRSQTSPSGGSYPAIAIPPLDVNAATTAPSREKHHILCVMRKDHSDLTPFEPGGVLMGGGTGRELYPLYTTAQGSLGAPADNSFMLWHPPLTKSCDFVTSSDVVTVPSFTTGLYVGMRMRQTAASYSLPEDVHIVEILSISQIRMSTTWPAGNSTVDIQFFGLTWFAMSAIDHGTLAGLADDDHAQYLLLAGRSGGQKIGTVGNVTAMAANDVAMCGGSLIINNFGTSFAKVSGRVMDVRANASTIQTVLFLTNNLGNATGAGTGNTFVVQVTGSLTAAGTSTIRGLNFQTTVTPGAGVTVDEQIGALWLVTGSTGGGVFDKLTGQRVTVRGDTANSSTIANGIVGLEIQVGSAKSTSTLRHIALQDESNPITGAVSDWWGIDFGSTAIVDDAQVANWTAIRIPDAPANPTGTIRALSIGNIKSHHVGALRLGDATTPTHRVELAAGTTAIAPILLVSGTSLTTPVAGTIEYTDPDLFFTIGGPARKAFVLDDGTRLTSGRVPFATTNGRLTDDADMTFATDTLTVTKIAATQFTGDIQFTGGGVGWPYGSCYGNEIGWSQAAAGAGTFYEVSDADVADGELNNVTHDGSGKLTVTIAGRYLITYSVSLEADAANIHLVSAISINGTEISPGRMHFHRAAASAAVPLAGTAVVNLAANDTVEVAVATGDAGAPLLSVEHINLSVVQVGG